MSAFLDGIGAVLGKITQYIPGRIEKLKNERERLFNERNMLTSKEFSASAARRIVAIDARMLEINNILANNSKDG
jgi:hypothetical protein